ncbi:predicted protein [Uncinocarpus reesii 1704]|uniref:Dynactin subunit 6 n=1 Tax=Uncinocarpus reesii (strain UAMH 1704) TaxID=336963 RepID=C4JSF6_UNCRE|nr:uncharacterized protein UREG_05395 [Uncinocarpus reesii 1704]EEP80553.1 predicted protein [Uncinocarpus reesii 1704]
MSASQKPTGARSSSNAATRTGPPANPPHHRPPLSVHPTATISETAYFQGKHPISIGAGTVIHPRAKLLSYEGPISVGEGCIIGEKSVIGGPQAAPSASEPPSTNETRSSGSAVTIIENSVLVGPLATIHSGSHIHSFAAIDASSFLGRRVRIGRHAKVCSLCRIPEDGAVEDWIVVWGGGAGGMGLQRRKRANGRGNEGNVAGLNGRSVENARLVVLSKERETLTKLIGIGAAAATQRRR